MCKSGGPAEKPLAQRCIANGFVTAKDVMRLAKEHCDGIHDDHRTQKMDLEQNNGLEFRLFNWKSGDSGPFVSGMLVGILVCLVLFCIYYRMRQTNKKRDAKIMCAVAPRRREGNTDWLLNAVRRAEQDADVGTELAALRRSIWRHHVRAAHERDAHRFEAVASGSTGERYVA